MRCKVNPENTSRALTMANRNRERRAEIERIKTEQQAEVERLTMEADRVEHSEILSQAHASLAEGKHQRALEYVESIYSSEHVGPEARLLYASILADDGRDESAISELENLLNEKPKITATAYSLLAQLRWRNLRYNDMEGREVIEEYGKRANELFPDSAEAYYIRALTTFSIKDKLNDLDKALKIDRFHYEARRLRALIHQVSRQYDKLEQDAFALTMLPDRKDDLGHALRAKALAKQNKYAQALDEYNIAIELATEQGIDYIDLTVQHGEVLLLMREYDQVIEKAQKCLMKIPPDFKPIRFQARLQFHIFCGFTAKGQYDQASVLFERIMDAASQSIRDYLTRDYFVQWSRKYVFDTLAAKQSWHQAGNIPQGSAFRIMREAEANYHELDNKADRLMEGFSPQWSPGGRQLIFSLGVPSLSGIATYDLDTRETELLVVPGRNPSWSPDGNNIAFIRDRHVLHLEMLVTAESERRGLFYGNKEIWIMKADGSHARGLGCHGEKLSWSSDSRHIIFWDTSTRFSISIEDRGALPQPIQENHFWRRRVFSAPDNLSDAYLDHGYLRILDRNTLNPLHVWKDLPGLVNGIWAPGNRQFSAGVHWNYWKQAGLWFFDLDTGQAAQIFSGNVIGASWSPDETALAITLGASFNEIWLAELDPNKSVIESLRPGRSIEAYHRTRVDYYTRRIESDPGDAHCYLKRAECYKYLHEKDQLVADMERYVQAIRPSVIENPKEQRVRDFLKRLWQSTPKNLGPIVNSGSDENYVAVSSDGRSLFFSSDRPEPLSVR